ncbi:MAG: DUF4160 domain-containing protein [Gemmataceae bacterium]|nr:DUF4160 domain-containing protein [Gemmataceae bacterium]
MAKVDCLDIPGLVCWFWSNDHEPPHFHVKREGEWELKVNFLANESEMFELQWGDTPKAKLCRQIATAVLANRAALLVEWQAKVNHGS